MKLTTTSAIAVLTLVSSLTLAAPYAAISKRKTSQPDDPPSSPVDIMDIATTYKVNCGGTIHDEPNFISTVQWAVNLQNAGKMRGKKSNLFPNGRFPHSYTDTDFPFNPDCPADANRQEYPILQGDVYNGGLGNDKWGPDRVVYYYKPGEKSPSGQPRAYFCGAITHTGAAQGKFNQCLGTVGNGNTPTDGVVSSGVISTS